VTDLEAVEFWPDYSGALLHVGGAPVQLGEFPIPADVVIRVAVGVGRYDDSKLPFGDRPDADWMAEGRALFAILRECLAADDITLVDWEGIWAVPPSD
jgi:hypothetical protein